MANMVNMNNLLNGKDSRWLQLEVCREFQRNKCTRPDTECKFAHPPTNVEVLNGRVTACYDSIKGRCNRDKPPCKYFHPPQHLKDQLLINGRNHLALKNALLHQMGLASGQPLVPGQVPTVATTPYLTGMPQVSSTFSPYFSPAPMMPTLVAPDPTGSLGMVQQTVVAATTAQQKMARSDRLEPATAATSMSLAPSPIELAGRKRTRNPSDDLLMMDMKAVGQLYYDNFAFPGMAYKRAAGDKSGVPMYQPGATATYQQLLQPFVPVSCEYRLPLAAAGNMAAFTTGVALNKAPTVTVPATPTPQQFLRLPTPSAQSQFALPTLPSQSISNFLAAAQLNASTATTNNNNNNDEDSQLQPFKKMKTT